MPEFLMLFVVAIPWMVVVMFIHGACKAAEENKIAGFGYYGCGLVLAAFQLAQASN